MCEIISVAVDPKTAEVFWEPGVEHHTQLCQLKGIQYDRVFKPDIHLYNKQIDFHDGPIAFKSRKMPDDGFFIRNIVNMALSKDAKDQWEARDYVYQWGADHQKSVFKWMEEHIADYKKLIGFADHSWNPYHFRGTVEDGRFHKAIDGLSRYAIEADTDSRELLHETWRRDFQKADNRVAVWK